MKNYDEFDYEQNFDPSTGKKLGTASLVCGILSVIGMLFSGFGVFPGIASLIIFLVGDQKGIKNKMFTWGAVLGVIGSMVSITILVIYLLPFACFPEEAGTLSNPNDIGTLLFM